MADADDAVQETLIAAWNQLDKLEKPDAVRSWLTSILSRKATDRLRARRPDTPIGNDENEYEPVALQATPDAVAETDSQLAALGRVLTGLPAIERQAWVLREVSGYSYDEIVDQLDTTSSTVRGALARARATVVARMEEWR